MSDPATWPLRGLFHFCSRPKLWPGTLLANLLAWLATLAGAGLVVWLTWPADPQDWWAATWRTGLAIGWGLLTFVACWMILLPIVLALAYEQLSRRILTEHGHSVVEEGNVAAARSAVVFVLRTLHWRIGWLVLGLCTLVFPPLSYLCNTVGLGHIALLDACDAALAMQGVSGGERARLIARHQPELLLGGLTAGLSGHGLGLTLIGWLWWMPGLYVAAALHCPSWVAETPETLSDTPVAPALEQT